MTVIKGNNISDNPLEQQPNALNPFAGVSKVLDSVFKPMSLPTGNVVDNPQNFNVQSNPFNNTEKIDATKQLIGGHSINYVMSANSVFENNVSNSVENAENCRNKYGVLEFYS